MPASRRAAQHITGISFIVIIHQPRLVSPNIKKPCFTYGIRIYRRSPLCNKISGRILHACILYYDQRSQNDRRQLESYQQNLPIYESLITEIRSKQHEYTNRIQALSSLGHTCGDYDELLDALDRYAKEYSRPLQAYPLLLIDKPLLAASLYSLASHAEAEGIRTQFVVDDTEIRSIATEVQMADLTGALLQNAIEASQPGDHIHVWMHSDGQRLDFEVRNPVPSPLSQEEVNQFFQLGYSTKNRASDDTSPHGLGLHQVSVLCNKLGGQITASCIREVPSQLSVDNNKTLQEQFENTSPDQQSAFIHEPNLENNTLSCFIIMRILV